MRLALLQVVRVLRDIPEEGLLSGRIGTVVESFDSPRPAYQVEFIDPAGRTLKQAALAEEDLEALGANPP